MSETREVQVKAKHIRKGRAGKPGCCAMALALQDAFDGQPVSVGIISTVVFESGVGQRSYWSLDEHSQDFITWFDKVKRKDRKDCPQLQPFTAVLTRKLF